MVMNRNTLAAFFFVFLCAAGATHPPNAVATPWECDPQPNPAQTELRPPELTPSQAAAENHAQCPAPGRMFVVGRVLDPKGKPVPGAEVLAYARDLAPGPIAARMGQIALGGARADGSGEFRIDAPRASSSRA